MSHSCVFLFKIIGDRFIDDAFMFDIGCSSNDNTESVLHGGKDIIGFDTEGKYTVSIKFNTYETSKATIRLDLTNTDEKILNTLVQLLDYTITNNLCMFDTMIKVNKGSRMRIVTGSPITIKGGCTVMISKVN